VLAEPEGLAVGELSPDALAQTRAVVAAAASHPQARGGRVAVVGVSGGATLALLTAADPELAERVSVVVALAPCCDIVEAIRVVTTDAYLDRGTLVPFATRDFFKLVIARSVVATLPAGESRSKLGTYLRSLEDYGPEPLAQLRAFPREGLDASACAALELLANVEQERVEELLAALPAAFSLHLGALSPLAVAHRIAAPVELVIGRADKYFPPADAAAFARACPSARLTVLESLEHAVPSFSPAAARDLFKLNGVLVRMFASARSAESYSFS
jgi:pimeloyl-ACP methyl ester carboxylesterase